MSEQEKAFCRRLAMMFSDIATILGEHLNDNAELLPHVFMGDVTRYVLDDGSQRIGVVQQLEDAITAANGNVEELISVSFVENIKTADELNRALNGITGNALKQEWKRQHID